MAVQTTYVDDLVIALEGAIADKDENGKLIVSHNNEEATAEIHFGHAVKRGTNDQDALNLVLITDAILGIVTHSHAFVKDDELGDDGLKPGTIMNVMRRGRIWAVCEDGCSPGDRLHVRAIVAGAEVSGELRASADGIDTVDATGQGEWQTTAAAGGLAILEVDFLNDAT